MNKIEKEYIKMAQNKLEKKIAHEWIEGVLTVPEKY